MSTECDPERVTETNFGNLLSRVATHRRAYVLAELQSTIKAERAEQERIGMPDHLLLPAWELLPSGQKKAPEPR